MKRLGDYVMKWGILGVLSWTAAMFTLGSVLIIIFSTIVGCLVAVLTLPLIAATWLLGKIFRKELL